jgi:hypothetical protein
VRAFSEAQWITWEDLDWQRKEIVIRGAPATCTKNSEIRRVPMLPNMEELLLQPRGNSPDDGQVIHVPRCDQILDRAYTKAGIPRITLHDLRHLFATRCIESADKVRAVKFKYLDHLTVCEVKELCLTSGDRLQVKANSKTRDAHEFAIRLGEARQELALDRFDQRGMGERGVRSKRSERAHHYEDCD